MSGLRIVVRTEGFDRIEKALAGLGAFDRGALLDQIGGIVESQTRRRIFSEKTAPDGGAWRPNLEGSEVLVRSSGLLDSIGYQVSGDSVEVGSGLIYAAIHQLGGSIRPKGAKRLAFTLNGSAVFARQVTIPPRPYLGLSGENADEIEDLSLTFIGGLLS